MLLIATYLTQAASWPNTGRHILAQYDDESIIVYQAYRSEIGQFALEHAQFGGEFSFSRMSWIKPNFLWMMYRSGWGTRPGQEMTLAIRIRRSFFESLLAQAVESSFIPGQLSSEVDWQHALATSRVRIQWDPDHHPTGSALLRRALQLGLKGKILQQFATKEILEIVDLTGFVTEQREKNISTHLAELVTPLERVYIPRDPAIRDHIRLDD